MKFSKRIIGLTGLALAVAIVPGAIYMGSGTVGAANGDQLASIIANRAGTACASIDVDGNHSSVGVGIAFDGTKLLISCYSDNTITEINPANGAQIAVHTISGASSLGAMAWDAANSRLWACSGFTGVGLVNLSTNVFTPVFTSAGCFDGLAYDGVDNTIWSSHDVASTVEHYTAAGALLSVNSVSGKIGSCGSSGIAVGGAKLYLANNGCSQIFEASKDFSSSVLFASFARRLEDLECDDRTFAGAGKGAIWSIDAYDNVLNAWEIPLGQCGLGGQAPTPTPVPGDTPTPVPPTATPAPPTATPVPPTATPVPPTATPVPGGRGRMTGGGSIGNTGARHGFELHCNAATLPNRLEVNWGKGNKFHLESLTSASCTDDPGIVPNPPAAGFDTYTGKGGGRYNGAAGATAEWTFTDAGEPGKNDTATITIKDAGSNIVLSVSGKLQNGNQQAHKN